MNKFKITRKQQVILAMLLFICSIILFVAVGVRLVLKNKGYVKEKKAETETAAAIVPVTKVIEAGNFVKKSNSYSKQLIAKAERLAASYDYDAAIRLLRNNRALKNNRKAEKKIAEFRKMKAACVPVKIDEVTHIFYHSLVVDPQRAFADQENNRAAAGNNQWMTTLDEFNKITQEMYERGYVMVSIHDLIEKRTDHKGNEQIKPGTILLPPGKKAFVLSLDDLSYYHSYENYGFASKMVLDKKGNPICEYIKADGSVVTGAYDVVPLIDQFVKKHPDASYRGAKGVIALTGYNGILGYRTDISYQTVPADLNLDKKAWLEKNPKFNLQKERKKAQKVADAMKERGWEFASHTWGHLKVGEISIENLKADTQKWRENVEPIVGPTDTIIFAHGEDLDPWGEYRADNPKFQYLMDQGYRIYCNVDSRQYGTWYGNNYMRQSRRNLDGYRIYNNAIGQMDSLSDLFPASEIMDSQRPPVKPLK